MGTLIFSVLLGPLIVGMLLILFKQWLDNHNKH